MFIAYPIGSYTESSADLKFSWSTAHIPKTDQGTQNTKKKFNAGNLKKFYNFKYPLRAEFDFSNTNPHIYDQLIKEKPNDRRMKSSSPTKSVIKEIFPIPTIKKNTIIVNKNIR